MACLCGYRSCGSPSCAELAVACEGRSFERGLAARCRDHHWSAAHGSVPFPTNRKIHAESPREHCGPAIGSVIQFLLWFPHRLLLALLGFVPRGWVEIKRTTQVGSSAGAWTRVITRRNVFPFESRTTSRPVRSRQSEPQSISRSESISFRRGLKGRNRGKSRAR